MKLVLMVLLTFGGPNGVTREESRWESVDACEDEGARRLAAGESVAWACLE